MKKRMKMKGDKAKMLRKGMVKPTKKAPGGSKRLIGEAGGVRRKPVRPRGGGLSLRSRQLEKQDIPV